MVGKGIPLFSQGFDVWDWDPCQSSVATVTPIVKMWVDEAAWLANPPLNVPRKIRRKKGKSCFAIFTWGKKHLKTSYFVWLTGLLGYC